MFLGTCLLGKKCLLSKLLDLDTREGLQVLSPADRTRKTKIKADIKYLAFLEEISWGQKSKALFSKKRGIIILYYFTGLLTPIDELIQ